MKTLSILILASLIMSPSAFAEAQKTFSQVADDNISEYNSRNPRENISRDSGVYSADAGQSNSNNNNDYKKNKKNSKDTSLSSFYRPKNKPSKKIAPSNKDRKPASVSGGTPWSDPKTF